MSEVETNQIQFTEDELKSLSDLRVNYNNLTLSFGALEVSRMQTEQRLSSMDEERARLEEAYNEALESERKLVEDLTEKYGQGSLDIQTGVFTPVEAVENVELEEPSKSSNDESASA